MKNRRYLVLLFVITLFLSGLFFYELGRSSNDSKTDDKTQELYALNRNDLVKLYDLDDPIVVVGHKSPDSDTVCTAIAYARLLNKAGIDAKPMISEKVNNETAYILEITDTDMPEILYDASGKNIIMVDHSEYAQAVEGMSDANILGVIDHHGVGTINVAHQLLYNAKPIGSTATIIYLTYRNYGYEIDKDTAYLLLGAVLSDTSNLTGSTTTETDKVALKDLADIAGVENTDELYAKIHEKALSYEGFSDEEILLSDFKEYQCGETRYGIGLVNAIDEENAIRLAENLSKVIGDVNKTKGLDLLYGSIRDEATKTDYIIFADERSRLVLENAFPNYDEANDSYYVFKSGLGRKTKFVPGLDDYLNLHPHE